jgi:hypothetical protein
MSRNISFSINLHGKEFNGYLQTNDTTDPPKVFFVFLENWIVGDLLFENKQWIFKQGGRYKFLKQLNTGEKQFLAEYFGNLVELWYE